MLTRTLCHTFPADFLPAPEANIAQQLKLKPKKTLTCLDRGDTLSPLQALYAVADQAGDQWVRPQLCYCQHLHVLMLFWCSLSSHDSIRLQTGNTMST